MCIRDSIYVCLKIMILIACKTGCASLNFKPIEIFFTYSKLVLVLFDSAIMPLYLGKSPMNLVGEDGCSCQQPSSSNGRPATGPMGPVAGSGVGAYAYRACAGRGDVMLTSGLRKAGARLTRWYKI